MLNTQLNSEDGLTKICDGQRNKLVLEVAKARRNLENYDRRQRGEPALD